MEYACIPDGWTVAILGAGSIGDMASRIAAHRGHRVITVGLVPERLERVRRYGVETADLRDTPAKDLGDAIRELTDGRGPDAVIDAVGMEAHGSPGGKIAQGMAALVPDAMAQKVMEKAKPTSSGGRTTSCRC